MIKNAVLAAAVAAATVAASPAVAAPPAPLDKQNWSFQDNLTWSDYKPLPGPNYADPSIQPSVKKWKVALIMVDYPDRSFTISQPAGSTIYGTPSTAAHSIPRAEVPKFYGDFFNTPSPLNNYQTINRYWMENSYGKYGVELVPYGPYQLPKKSYQYHIGNFQTPADCPDSGDPAERCDATYQPVPGQPTNPLKAQYNYFNAVRDAWAANVPPAERATFDNAYYVSAGQDESATWQEFGEMRFTGPEAVTDPFGPKHIDPLHPRGNWASTRYIPWTSWAAASNIWPSAQGTVSSEAESSGMAVFAHELSHNLGLPDNYNNPFAAIPQRTAGGMWDMMSRGSFNGPGGQHTRWMIPPTQGAALGAQHGIRNKQKLNFVAADDVLTLNRGGLAQTGTMVAEVKAREVAPGDDLAGVRVVLNDGGDKNPVCRYQQNPMCEGPWYYVQGGQERISPGFDDYTVEVVQQIGSDSFTGGSGVLIGKNKTQNSSCGSFNCQTWYIDANPQDINQVDYVKADGTPVKATLGDERQTNDGTFHAGTNSGSKYEFTATNNQLQFYILDKRTDADGINRYKIGIRSLAGAGPQTHGVSLSPAAKGTSENFPTCTFTLKNTGTAAAIPAGAHPTADVAKYFNSDIYRLTATSNTTGWTAHLKNALATAEYGQSVDVPVYIEKAAGAPATGSVTLNATSESDPSKSMSVTCSYGPGDTVGGTVPATLALSLDAPANFGAFTPGMQKDYYASTKATVVSTAADATLSVTDPSSTAPGHLVNGAFTLPEPLQVNGTRGETPGNTYAPLSGSVNLFTWGAPASNDTVAVGFKQPVKANDALRTGTYAKTLTFTLSTTNP